MKKKLRYIGILILILIAASLAFVPIGNNIILNKYTNELNKVVLNADYKVLASDNECGKLSGNGNGMQYFSAELIYSKDTLKSENNDLEGVFLIPVTDDYFSEFFNDYSMGRYCPNIKKELNHIKNPKNYYVLYSFYAADLHSIWNNDLRAH